METKKLKHSAIGKMPFTGETVSCTLAFHPHAAIGWHIGCLFIHPKTGSAQKGRYVHARESSKMMSGDTSVTEHFFATLRWSEDLEREEFVDRDSAGCDS